MPEPLVGGGASERLRPASSRDAVRARSSSSPSAAVGRCSSQESSPISGTAGDRLRWGFRNRL